MNQQMRSRFVMAAASALLHRNRTSLPISYGYPHLRNGMLFIQHIYKHTGALQEP